MTELSICILRKIIAHLLDEYTVEFDNGKNNYKAADNVEIDVGLKKLIVKNY